MGGRGGSSGSKGGGGASSGISTSGLPKLEGSEKQIAWANSIRENYIKDVNDRIANGDINYFDIDGAYYRGTGAQEGRLQDGDGNMYRTPYSIKAAEIRAKNPGMSAREIRDKAESYISDLSIKANERARNARKAAKASGASKEEIKAAGKKAESSVYAPVYKQWVKNDLKVSKSSSAWIDTFKGTKYSRK